MKYVQAVLIVFFTTFGMSAVAESPESVVKKYFETLKTSGYAEVGQYMHPDSLEAFKERLLPVFKRDEAKGGSQLATAAFGKQLSYKQVTEVPADEFAYKLLRVTIPSLGLDKESYTNVTIIGEVDEGKKKHIVVRLAPGATETGIQTKLRVISLAPMGNSWGIVESERVDEIVRRLISWMI